MLLSSPWIYKWVTNSVKHCMLSTLFLFQSMFVPSCTDELLHIKTYIYNHI